ncbi:DUF1028 domain-containing protein [Spirosoma utsteinense]|uniref:Ntn-hydrolase superfamily protein n=1 Tax=Spirosoma utsteinense TaxID=2585773 RepID=A0ABR6WD31_9BACT|nr:DUF1028 domain-containing protein [Spirosoma utsteinense]MBC3785296.1 putative Ntn-hydrolase superfamily protein [Spirosoma utsteinense]MBC3793900.1 putative Ntn-hydrolase superfamily protein [Spirosoma utsteinense]
MRKILLLFLSLPLITNAQHTRQGDPFAHTFSIVARDPKTGDLAVGVQSHWFSVGTSVSWGEAGVGVVATQSFTNKSFGIRGLQLLKSGKTAQQALDELLRTDEGREVRQVAIADAKGNVAVHTGKKCIDFAGHHKGANYSVQANMMLKNTVPDAMAKAFEANSKLPLPERVLSALNAAQAAGGDIRGRQSAVLLVVKGKATGAPWDDNHLVDLRVDDAVQPLPELARLLRTHRAYEHMNNGDLATEKNDMKAAMQAYGSAMKLFPKNLEMQYWTAIALANTKQVPKAAGMLQQIYAQDGNWRELTRRLPRVGLLTVSTTELAQLVK